MDQSDKYFQAIQSMRWTDRMHQMAIDSQTLRMGIHRNQHMLLMYLSKCEFPPTQVDIAKEFKVTAASVAEMLNKLENSGFIQRNMFKGNHRSKYIQITDEGRNVVDASRRMFSAVDKAMYAGISDEELSQFMDLLGRMQNNLINYDPEIGNMVEDEKQNRKGECN